MICFQLRKLDAMIFLLLIAITLTFVAPCPEAVKDQYELISLSLDCFRKLYDPARFDGHKISREVSERMQTYRRMLQEVKMEDEEHLHTTPVLKWAQGQSQLYLNFKLSHRHDSPTCSDIRSQFFTTGEINETESIIPYEIITGPIKNYSTFSFKGECFFTNEKLLFTLNLKFEGVISKLTLLKEGLGSYTIVGDKGDRGLWMNPFNEHRKAAIWPEIRNKFTYDMDRYLQLIEMSQDAQAEQEPKRKRNRRPKIQKTKRGQTNNEL